MPLLVEEILKSEGFGQLQVRDYGKIARIEVLAKDLPKLFKKEQGIGLLQNLRNYIVFM